MTNDCDLNHLTDDDLSTLYSSTLAAIARLLDDDIISTITSDRDASRDFIASLAHDPDAATDSPADCMIATYRLTTSFFALDDLDLLDDLITAMIAADRLPADFASTSNLDTYLY